MKTFPYLLLALGACATTGGDDGNVEQESGSTRYVQIVDFDKIDQDQWYGAIHSLNAQFDDICGDTFCEGDFTNLTPLTFACSVTSKAGNVKDCAWTFAASTLDVDTRTANLVVNAPTFECHIQAKTTAVKLAAILAGDESLYAALPGAPSIYDQLSECFEHPIGATAGEFATTGTERYVSSRDFYSGAGLDRWYAARAAARLGFDNICGDTFCGGDMSDLQMLDLQCAVTKSTGNVKQCTWIFGGSYYVVPEKTGKLQATHDTFNCKFNVNGTLSQLITTLTAAGTDSPIFRPLPGGTATMYDSLFNCLP